MTYLVTNEEEFAECPEFHFTPREVCEELMKDIKITSNDSILEPCKGRSVGEEGDLYGFWEIIKTKPGVHEWCEIDEGRDLFTWDFGGEKFTKVIVNPPYRTNHKLAVNRKNICMEFIFKCLDLCSDEAWFLLNLNMLNSLTPIRLEKIKNKGFVMNFMRVLNIKRWRNRYYWICFSKNKKSIIFF